MGKIRADRTLPVQSLTPQLIMLCSRTDSGSVLNYAHPIEFETDLIRLIGEGKDLKEAVECLKSEFDAPEGAIEKDVADFVAMLRKEGLISG